MNEEYLRPKSLTPTYPPYHQGEYLEEYFYSHYQQLESKPEREYIDIFWSNIFCNKIWAGKEYPNLMWVDTDIVFKENPVDILTGHEEVLFQTDAPGSTICTGFMVFNETPECRQLVAECGADETDDDQLIMNRIALTKYNDHVALLSEDLFPNGNVYYQQGKKDNAMIVHNNWMVGVETKINKFKEEGLWFI